MKTPSNLLSSDVENPFRPLPTRSPRDLNMKSPAPCIREILVPIDFSEHSGNALKYAALFAAQFGAAITLLNVVEPPLVNPETVYPYTAHPDQISRTAERLFERTCHSEKLKPPVLRQTLVVPGTPCEKIVETAVNKQSDLIIIATHGRTGLAHVLLGSTAEKVIRHAPCPVLVVRLNNYEPIVSQEKPV